MKSVSEDIYSIVDKTVGGPQQNSVKPGHIFTLHHQQCHSRHITNNNRKVEKKLTSLKEAGPHTFAFPSEKSQGICQT